MGQSDLEECLRLLIPIVKLSESQYLIGTKQRQILMKNTNLLVRVGGGFMGMKEYLKQ